MKIAIEATLAQGKKTGLGNYVSNLIEHISILDKENKYILLHSSKDWTGKNFGSNFEPVSYYLKKESIGILFNLERKLRKVGAELFHSTYPIGFYCKPTIPIVTTIHDMFPLFCRNSYSIFYKYFFRYSINWTAQYSSYFIYNSEVTKDEFTKYFNISSDKGEVVYLGPSFDYSDVRVPNKIGPIICVGAIELRKNQMFLLNAYSEALDLFPNLPDLIFIGPERKSGRGFAKKIIFEGLSRKVKWLNYITNEELIKQYATASLMLYPSSLEGFGIPLVDAINCNLPVICSDIPIFREIGKSYPIFAKCNDKVDWIKKIIDFYKTPCLTTTFNYDLMEKYGWKSCAKKILEVYRKL